MKIIFITIFISALIVYSEPVPPSDQDRGSAQFLYYVDQLSTAEAAFDNMKAGKQAYDAAKNAQNINLWDAAKKAALGSVVKYRTSKASFISMCTKALTWTNNILTKASKRVDMWRTTYPTLVRYKDAALRLVDDTKELFTDFTWKRFFDPKRKWDKKRESLVNNYSGLYYSFSGYMKHLYYEANSDKINGERRKASADIFRIMVPNYNEAWLHRIMNQRTRQIDSASAAAHEYRKLPLNTLELCASTMYALTVLESQYLHPDKEKPDITASEATLNNIQKELEKLDQTYVDSRELSAYIAQERAQVRLQTVKAAQYQSNIEINYANLLSHDKEIKEAQAVAYEHTLQVLMVGADAYEEYYDNYLNSIR